MNKIERKTEKKTLIKHTNDYFKFKSSTSNKSMNPSFANFHERQKKCKNYLHYSQLMRRNLILNASKSYTFKISVTINWIRTLLSCAIFFLTQQQIRYDEGSSIAVSFSHFSLFFPKYSYFSLYVYMHVYPAILFWSPLCCKAHAQSDRDIYWNVNASILKRHLELT